MSASMYHPVNITYTYLKLRPQQGVAILGPRQIGCLAEATSAKLGYEPRVGLAVCPVVIEALQATYQQSG